MFNYLQNYNRNHILVTMRIKIMALVSLMIIFGTIGACTTKAEPLTFPTATVRDVPSPAPVPWPNVTTYTEQTYKIEVNIDQQFAIGMFATIPAHFIESHNQSFINKVYDQMVEYQPSTPNMYGTQWFLFKATKAGNTEIIFQYPLEYTKLFKISIH